MNKLQIKIGEEYVISPNFFQNSKRASVITRKIVVIKENVYDNSEQVYYTVRELSDGPPAPRAINGVLWSKGDLFTLSQLSWKFQHVNSENV